MSHLKLPLPLLFQVPSLMPFPFPPYTFFPSLPTSPLLLRNGESSHVCQPTLAYQVSVTLDVSYPIEVKTRQPS